MLVFARVAFVTCVIFAAAGATKAFDAAPTWTTAHVIAAGKPSPRRWIWQTPQQTQQTQQRAHPRPKPNHRIQLHATHKQEALF